MKKLIILMLSAILLTAIFLIYNHKAPGEEVAVIINRLLEKSELI